MSAPEFSLAVLEDSRRAILQARRQIISDHGLAELIESFREERALIDAMIAVIEQHLRRTSDVTPDAPGGAQGPPTS